MESILRGLNKAQRAAVTSTASILQVLAPPGSGKTKTLTSRVAYLLSHHGYAPPNVICCTFTIKASKEMRERLRGMIGDQLESKLILGTFHSICRRYLISYGHLIGVPKNFGIADSDDSLNIIKRAIKRLNLSIDAKLARSRISHRKARGKKLEDLYKLKKTVETQEFATIFQEYEDNLEESNLLDYDDLLLKCVELLQHYPGCVSNVEALLIDEFQDTNIVQFELMKLLASAKKRITIVGDPDQSIYGFRSAEIENLHRMRACYPDTVVINLEENYRSCSSILNLAQAIIEQDTERPEKKLKSTKIYGTLPVLRRLPNPFEEAQWIAAETKRVLATTGGLMQYSDIAILLRSAYLSLHIEKALANLGIPYRMVGGRRFFDRLEIRILIDYLKVISHPENNAAFLAIVNTPKRKVGDTTIKELTKTAQLRKESVWTVAQKVSSGSLVLDKKLSKSAEQGLQDVVALISKARGQMAEMEPVETPSKLLRYLVKSLKYQDFLTKEHPEDHEERWENVEELLSQATDAALHFNVNSESLPDVEGFAQDTTTGPEEILAQFLSNVSLSTEVETEDGAQDPRITISTIHSAKGLEWPVVIVPAVYEGSIPHSRAEDTAEERRLLYVAVTRAKSLLYMTFPVTQQRYESDSILTQFLPPNIMPLVSQIGPVFPRSIVSNLADILERQFPTDQEVASSLQTIKDSESAEDDIWPWDGGHRQRFLPMQSAFPGMVLQKGQSLSDALLPAAPLDQSRRYSTTMRDRFGHEDTTYSTTTNLNSGFTTAQQHLQTQPQLLDQPVWPLDSDKTAVKKPRLAKTISDQGSVHSFFTQGSLKPSQTLKNLQEHSSHQDNKIGRSSKTVGSHSQASRPVEPSIPAQLSNHRLISGNASSRNPESILRPPTSNDMNQKRNYYSAFQSDSLQENTFEHVLSTSTSVGMASSALTNKSTSTSTIRTTMTQLNETSKSYNFSASRTSPPGINQLQATRTSIGVKTTMNNLQTSNASGTPKRTLGIRRSMSGWADRKHK